MIRELDERKRRFEDSGKDPVKDRQELLYTLSAKECEAVITELDRCRKDFSYCARNYFWFVTRDTKQDFLFKLWESQEYLLDTIFRLKRAGRPMKVMVIKARRLGISTVAVALTAHSTFFFPNSNCLMVTFKDSHQKTLFDMVTNVYDRLPWYIKPMKANRETTLSRLMLANPNEEKRYADPGLRSMVIVETANSRGVGQGFSWVGAHISEFTDFEDGRCREIIEEDVGPALDKGPRTWGILESTPKGAGRYAHKFWKTMESLGDRAEWFPLYMPWFFDRGNSVTWSIPKDWKPLDETQLVAKRANDDWVRCGSKSCGCFLPRVSNGVDRDGTTCPFCNGSTMTPLVLTDGQLAWVEEKRLNASTPESLDTFTQEYSSNSEEAWITSGTQLFSRQEKDYARSTYSEKYVTGYVDKSLLFHGHNPKNGKCFVEGCISDHRNDGSVLRVWELPRPGGEYVVGADIGYGLGGDHDYSVAKVLRRGHFGGADVEVASFASNTIIPTDFADLLNRLGRFYNNAELASEVNAQCGGEVIHALRVIYNYPNLYRPINAEKLNMETNTIGWKTNNKQKARMYVTLRSALRHRSIVIKDKETVSELDNFTKEDASSVKMGASLGAHDDRLVALMIAEAVIHEKDWDEDGGIMRQETLMTMENAPFVFHCKACKSSYPIPDPRALKRCPNCGSMMASVEARQCGIPNAANPDVHDGWNPFDQDQEVYATSEQWF